MKNKIGSVIAAVAVCLVLSGLLAGSSHSDSVKSVAGLPQPLTVTAQQECAACTTKCEAWMKRCKEGGQYACYKAAACLCKCNLDAGGCGSSKEALRQCYEENEKRARELGPPEQQ
jgi:hypothetical protein